MKSFFAKDPAAVLDYKFDWKALTNQGVGEGRTDWLAASETISSFTVTAPTGITVNSSSATDTNTSVTAWLSGGIPGNQYNVVCHIVTSAGRTDERTIRISVQEL